MLWFSQVFENINIADRNYITEMDFLKLVFACLIYVQAILR